jgi:hypothetical protein
VSEFETRVESLLDSADQSNFSKVQSQLIDLFQESEHDDELRSDWAKRAYSMTQRFEDEKRALLLLSGALEVEWPQYERGDGYFEEPSDLATAATLIGINNCDDPFFQFSMALEPCNAIEYFDLGFVSNSTSSPGNVLFAISRSGADPVLSIASVAGALDKEQILKVLSKIDPIDAPGWMSVTLVKSDGWYWPDWQYAFGQASFNCEPSAVFWEVLLGEIRKSQENESSELSWIPHFMKEFQDCQGLDPKVSEASFELLTGDHSLRKLAMESRWEPLIEALERL